MKVEVINPFLESVANVLSTMAMLESTPGKPSLKNDDIAKGDVSGIIGMSGANVAGSMAISFPKNVACEIVKRMLGDELDEINDTITDLVGEVTNMVAGGAKNQLMENGYDIGMASPVVVTGEGHSITHKAAGKRILLPFTTEVGEFFVEVCLE